MFQKSNATRNETPKHATISCLCSGTLDGSSFSRLPSPAVSTATRMIMRFSMLVVSLKHNSGKRVVVNMHRGTKSFGCIVAEDLAVIALPSHLASSSNIIKSSSSSKNRDSGPDSGLFFRNQLRNCSISVGTAVLHRFCTFCADKSAWSVVIHSLVEILQNFRNKEYLQYCSILM